MPMIHVDAGQAGGELLFTYLHSIAWTCSLAESLMEPINRYCDHVQESPRKWNNAIPLGM